jgi:hypothetical protein
MIELLAKNQADGRYFFTEDHETVYVCEYPFEYGKKKFVDPLSVFSEKYINSDLISDCREFSNFDDFAVYAKHDCSPESRGIEIKPLLADDLKDLLIFASDEDVKEYLEIIKNKIEDKDLKGVKLLITQLSRSDAVCNSINFTQELKNLEENFDEIRFPAPSMPQERIKDITLKVKQRCNILCNPVRVA